MARQTPVATPPEVDEPDLDELTAQIAKVDAETEWETVSEAAPIKMVFDEIGDRFIGTYEGELHVPAEQNVTRENPEGEAFDMYLFRGPDDRLYSVNKSTKLELGMKKVSTGVLCRLTYVADIPTGRKLNPMKDITVDVARSK